MMRDTSDGKPGRRVALQYVLTAVAIALAGTCLGLAWTLTLAKDETREARRVIASLTKEKEQLNAELQKIKAPPEVPLDGEVFIVTKGGENIRLGLVEVGIAASDAIDEHVARKKEQADVQAARLEPLLKQANAEKESKEKAERAASSASLKTSGLENIEDAWAAEDKARKASWAAQSKYVGLAPELAYYSSGDYYFQDLPTMLAVTKTNSDGHFSLSPPGPGSYVIAARAQRAVMNKTEKYFWLVRLSLTSQKETVTLSNDNLTNSGSANSVVDTISW